MADEFYYDRNGKKIVLNPDPRYYAVRFSAGRTSGDAKLTAAGNDFLRNRSQPRRYIAGYNLQVFEIGALEETNTRASVRALNDEEEIEIASPVFRRSDSPDDVFYVDNRMVIEFVDGVDQQAAETFLAPLNAEYGVTVLGQLGYTKPRVGYLLQTPEGDGERGPVQLARLYYEAGNKEGQEIVCYVSPDLIQPRHFKSLAPEARGAPPTWTYQNEQWHLAKAEVPAAWAMTEGSASIIMGIADDGLDVTHAEFAGRVVDQYDFGTGMQGDATPKTPIDNHGTACAGVAVARGIHARGAAPACRIIAACTPDLMGSHDEALMFQWLCDSRADVISCSWGPPDGTGATYPLPDNVASAMRYCAEEGRDGKGIPIVWAAGNGDELVSNDGYSSSADVIAVAASTDNDTRSYYSDFGPEIWICAPSSGKSSEGNRRVFTTDRSGSDGYNFGVSTTGGDSDGHYTNDFGGTSSSAPLVAGIIGLMLSENPNLAVQDVKDILKNTADKIGQGYDANGHSPHFGYGRVNAQKAVAEARRRRTENGDGGGTSTGSGPGNGVPAVSGPEQVSRGGPTFQITLPPGRFYAFEAATREDLLAGSHDAGRTPDNFFATWQTARELTDQPTYRFPANIWTRLSTAPRLFYRIVTSTQKDRWVNSRPSEVGSVQIVD